MPFKSEKQRGYLLAHPEITDKQGRSVGRKWAKKYGGKVEKRGTDTVKALGIGVATGTVGGALANQFPSWEQRQRRKASQKGKIKKAYQPTSTDPDFNHQAAQRAFDLVMKMDADTAEVFCHLVVSDYFEQTVEKNLGTLQRHLNATISKQLDDLKRAHLRLVAKGYDPDSSVAYAQALAVVDTLISKDGRPRTPQEWGYQWKESDFRRDPSSGRFRTKITHNQTKRLKSSTFKQLTGADTPKEVRGVKLSEQDRIRFQDEYRQLSGFLDAVRESTGGAGNQSVMLHYRDAQGRPFSQLHVGSRPPIDDLADPNTRLVGVDAAPTTLTAGGAAFGLATALGGGMNPEQVRAINNIEGGGGSKFTQSWLASGEEKNSNAKLYGRLAASGEFLSATQLGPKTAMAGKFASIVGSAGPQAEAVLGPTARKTAYRYRGTEKTPERAMVRAYAQRVEQGKVYGEEMKEAGHGVREPRRHPQPGSAPSLQQMVQARSDAAGRAPSWSERELGRQALVDHLRQKMPKKNLYELQLASGSTPPSEGVIINADGQLVTQAIGYGDDHYLPFNLKNLKGLKGGEYIRTRSVGGLTSEDVYTALMMGARQVTVTSRSGTYTMEFEPDFRGGRRHNDKARRMTRRYEQILDAVQSQQVDRIDIDPSMRAEIEREVKEEMSGPGWTRRDQMEAIRERVDEFKASPYITEDDEKRAEAIISARSANASEAERNKIRAQVMDDLMDQKEVKFRLNSAGYKGALDALQEQFPYYIKKPRWTPPRDAEGKISTEQDAGYVEPGRNRPTAAAAGLFGAKNRGKHTSAAGKYSAAEADYQGARKVGGGRLEPVEEGTAKTGTSDVHDKRRAAIAEAKLEESWVEAALEVQKHARSALNAETQKEPEVRAMLAMTSAELQEPGNRTAFSGWAERYMNLEHTSDHPILPLKRKWEAAVGHRERKPYDKGNVGLYPKFPPTFPGEKAYELGAKPDVVSKEIRNIDRKAKASVISGGLVYSGLSDVEQEAEWRALKKMHDTLKADPAPLNKSDLDEIGVDPQSPALLNKLRTDPDAVLQQMEYLQRSRALTHGLSEETRESLLENKGKKVTTNETPTSEEQSELPKNVESQIRWGRDTINQAHALRAQINAKLEENGLNDGHRQALLKALEKLPDEGQIEQAQNAVAIWEAHQDQVRTKDDLGALNDSMKDDVDALMKTNYALLRQREHVEILLRPPKAP